jgi:hypothetical protein
MGTNGIYIQTGATIAASKLANCEFTSGTAGEPLLRIECGSGPFIFSGIKFNTGSKDAGYNVKTTAGGSDDADDYYHFNCDASSDFAGDADDWDPGDADWDGSPGTDPWSDGWITWGSPFAVELISFEAVPDDWAVKLIWITEAEIDNDRWLITRSVGAVRVENPVEGGEPPTQGYEQIADLVAQGSLSNYTYLDSTVTPNNTYWYKLGDVDTEVVTIDYSISGRSGARGMPVRLSVYDMSGRLCEILVDEEKSPGVYRASWTPANLSSGVYFFRMNGGSPSIFPSHK